MSEPTRPQDTPDAKPELQVPGRVVKVVDPHFMERDEHGKFLPGQAPKTGIMPGDSNRARELANRRWEAAERKSREAMLQAAKDGDISAQTPVEAWAAGVGAVYQGAVANAMDHPHDASKALAFVGKAAGMLRPQERGQQASVGVAIQVNVSDEVAAHMQATEARWRER